MDDRLSGRTTQQMKKAPQGAVFVWRDNHTHYPQALARALGRDDLLVVPLQWLTPGSVMGCRAPAVFVDHAAHRDTQALIAISHLRGRGTPVLWGIY